MGDSPHLAASSAEQGRDMWASPGNGEVKCSGCPSPRILLCLRSTAVSLVPGLTQVLGSPGDLLRALGCDVVLTAEGRRGAGHALPLLVSVSLASP